MDKIKKEGDLEVKSSNVDFSFYGEKVSSRIDYTVRDLRTAKQTSGEEETPIFLYIPGLGQFSALKGVDNIEARICELIAQNGLGGLVYEVALGAIPGKTMREKEKGASADLDAMVIAAFLKQELSREHPYRVVSFSESSAIAVSLPQYLDKYGLASREVGSNTLTMLSLTGTGDLVANPSEGYRIVPMFSKEVFRITADALERNLPILYGLVKEGRAKEAYSFLMDVLRDEAVPGFKAFGNVFKRVFSAPNLTALLNQFEKIVKRNPSTEGIDKTWDIHISVPAGDSLYTRILESGLQPEEVFPNANIVSCQMRGDSSNRYNHLTPMRKPELYLLALS